MMGLGTYIVMNVVLRTRSTRGAIEVVRRRSESPPTVPPSASIILDCFAAVILLKKIQGSISRVRIVCTMARKLIIGRGLLRSLKIVGFALRVRLVQRDSFRHPQLIVFCARITRAMVARKMGQSNWSHDVLYDREALIGIFGTEPVLLPNALQHVSECHSYR